MKSTRRTATAVVVVLLGIGALLFGLRSCDTADDDAASPNSSATPSESPRPQATKMGTTVIEEAIKTRLDERAGRATLVECPDRVAQKVGTTFDCDVFFADEPGTAAVSIAKVEIDGPDGRFAWVAEPTSGG